MSKSKLNAIAPADLIADFGVDGFRYALLRDNSFGPDGEFSYEAVFGRYNNDLANNFGNLLQRVSTVVHKKCGGVGPAPAPDSVLAPIAATAYREATAAWAKMQPNVALEATWRLIRETNAYLEDNEPWKLDPGPEVDLVMGDALEALRIVAVLAAAVTPDACEATWGRIGMPGSVLDQRLPAAANWGQYPGGLDIVAGDPLYPRKKA